MNCYLCILTNGNKYYVQSQFEKHETMLKINRHLIYRTIKSLISVDNIPEGEVYLYISGEEIYFIE